MTIPLVHYSSYLFNDYYLCGRSLQIELGMSS